MSNDLVCDKIQTCNIFGVPRWHMFCIEEKIQTFNKKFFFLYLVW